jgi:hypothetical protein
VNSKGPAPKYCCAAHRKRAYEARERDRLRAVDQRVAEVTKGSPALAKVSAQATEAMKASSAFSALNAQAANVLKGASPTKLSLQAAAMSNMVDTSSLAKVTSAASEAMKALNASPYTKMHEQLVGMSKVAEASSLAKVSSAASEAMKALNASPYTKMHEQLVGMKAIGASPYGKVGSAAAEAMKALNTAPYNKMHEQLVGMSKVAEASSLTKVGLAASEAMKALNASPYTKMHDQLAEMMKVDASFMQASKQVAEMKVDTSFMQASKQVAEMMKVDTSFMQASKQVAEKMKFDTSFLQASKQAAEIVMKASDPPSFLKASEQVAQLMKAAPPLRAAVNETLKARPWLADAVRSMPVLDDEEDEPSLAATIEQHLEAAPELVAVFDALETEYESAGSDDDVAQRQLDAIGAVLALALYCATWNTAVGYVQAAVESALTSAALWLQTLGALDNASPTFHGAVIALTIWLAIGNKGQKPPDQNG